MKKRGRQVGADGEKSRRLLLEIAAAQFALHGFYKTKISEIVKEANVTQPTFYLYFRSKEAIFEELINIFKEKLHEHVVESRLPADVEEGSLRERITYSLRLVFELFQQNKEVARIGFIVSEGSADIKAKMTEQIEKNLTAEIEYGYFHTDLDLGVVASAMVGAIEQLAVGKLWTRTHTPRELAESIIDLYLYGLKK